jgi:type 1 glutamine amidotransferase
MAVDVSSDSSRAAARGRAAYRCLLLLLGSMSALAQTPPNVTLELRASIPTKGYGYGWSTPLASAPSVLRWRFGIDLGDFPGTVQAALGEASTLRVANEVGSGTQRVSLEIPRLLAPGLYPGELQTVLRWNASLIAYRVPSLPVEEAAARELFEFAKALNIETLISERAPVNLTPIDKLAHEYGVSVALCGSYRTVVEAMSHAGPKIGACLNTGNLAKEGIRTDTLLSDLKDRILIVELDERADSHGNAPSLDTAAFLKALYGEGVTPSLFVVRAAERLDGSPAADLQRKLDALDAALRPLIADRALKLSQRSDQGRREETPEQRAARASYTAGNSTSWTPVTPELRAAIDAALPQHAIVKPKKPRKLLVIDLNLGYPGHTSIPTHDYGLKQLGMKTGAYQAVFDNNLENLKYPAIKQFDAIFLNNAVGLIFEDPQVREGLLRYVREGGGLGANHASVHAALDWPQFAQMLGAYPSSHREPTEKIRVKLDDPTSPLNAGFGGQEFSYADEYIRFTGPPYSRDQLHILLSIDVNKTDMVQMEVPAPIKVNLGREDSDYAISWIRDYARGRIFYTAFGHNPTMFATPQLARHVLGGLQFILGDLCADATPSSKNPKTAASAANAENQQ